MILGLVSTPSRYVHTLAVQNSFRFTGTNGVAIQLRCVCSSMHFLCKRWCGWSMAAKPRKVTEMRADCMRHSLFPILVQMDKFLRNTDRRESFHARVLSLHCTTETWGVIDKIFLFLESLAPQDYIRNVFISLHADM